MPNFAQPLVRAIKEELLLSQPHPKRRFLAVVTTDESAVGRMDQVAHLSQPGVDIQIKFRRWRWILERSTVWEWMIPCVLSI